ncbi:hypothetical protein P7K49_017889 [Saguinus oedipus]|uniref:Uncharacterized protein n=1 Tax=Saguinus oedipus TaxID=9490 RepID=A0ABQ9V5Q1_SAGOE|nr:hypothetical protein P7K49_017889 [Saguinus oedipus]
MASGGALPPFRTWARDTFQKWAEGRAAGSSFTRFVPSPCHNLASHTPCPQELASDPSFLTTVMCALGGFSLLLGLASREQRLQRWTRPLSGLVWAALLALGHAFLFTGGVVSAWDQRHSDLQLPAPLPQVSYFVFVIFTVYAMLPLGMRDAAVAGLASSLSHLLVLGLYLGPQPDSRPALLPQAPFGGWLSCDSKAGFNAGRRIHRPNRVFLELVHQCRTVPAVTRRGFQASGKAVMWFARGIRQVATDVVNETFTENDNHRGPASSEAGPHPQLAANAVLFLCGNVLGVYHKALMERALRATFREALSSLHSRRRLDTEKKHQVSRA